MIHGISSSPVKPSKKMEDLKNQSPSGPTKRDLETDIERLKAFGLTRDPTKNMSTGGYMNAHMSSLN